MMIRLMITWALSNGVTPQRQKEMQKKKFQPYELLEVKNLEREELLALMVFCDIRVMDGTPVVALSDDELRKAYVLWRSLGQKERMDRRKKTKKFIRKTTKFVRKHIVEGAEL